MKARVGIVGATGLVGESLIRVILGHPGARLSILTSDHAAGAALSEAMPSMAGICDLALSEVSPERLGKECDVVFTAKKSADSMELAPAILKGKARVIDIGGEFRFRDVGVYEKYYGQKHSSPELAREAIYGLPELKRAAIKTARLVANPGCYPTASLLPLVPLLREGIVEREGIIVSAVSGLSGAGRTYNPKSDNTFLACNENFKAYGLSGHKHRPEIEAELTEAVGSPVELSFIPQIGPFDRGIYTLIYARSRGKPGDAIALWRKTYKGEPFIRIYRDAGAVDVEHCRGTNFADLGAFADERTGLLVLVSALDNTLKGAAGQAVQNMNIMLGLPETDGLLNRRI